MSILKPCPFCGCQRVSVINRAEVIHGERRKYTYVRCDLCRAQTRPINSAPVPHDGEQAAVEAWNRRAGGDNR